MPTREDYLRLPLAQRLARLAGTADELAGAIRDRSAAQLPRRHGTPNWSATAQWLRGGIHLRLGRLTLGDWVASLAAHDDNHLAQLERAIDGRA